LLSSSFEITVNYVALEISGGGEVGNLNLDVEATFRSQGGCGLLVRDFDVSIGFPFCCAEVASEVSFSCSGFEEAVFEVSDIEILGLPWVTLDAELAFELDEKTLELSPSFVFGDVACFDLYIDLATSANLALGAVNVYGIGLTCDIGAVSFEALSYLDGTHKLQGKYWEMHCLSFNDEGCCGPFSGDVAVYFLKGGARLFDVAYIEGSLSVALDQSLTFDMTLAWDIEAGILDQWTCGFAVSW